MKIMTIRTYIFPPNGLSMESLSLVPRKLRFVMILLQCHLSDATRLVPARTCLRNLILSAVGYQTELEGVEKHFHFVHLSVYRLQKLVLRTYKGDPLLNSSRIAKMLQIYTSTNKF